VCALLDEGGALNLEDSSVSAFSGASRREALIRSTNSRVYAERSSFSLEGNYGLIFEMTGGSLFLKDSLLSLTCLRTGTILSLNGLKGEFSGVQFFAEAGDFASVLESKNVPLLARNCVFRARARDAALVSLETESLPPDEAFLFLDSSFKVESSFVARAMEIRGIFPSVSGCAFRYEGDARNAEIFSLAGEAGRAPRLPPRGLIGGNSFGGFRLILGRDYPAENLEGFNRGFAPRGRDNTGAGPD
jgi:hypothetical protein